MALMDRIREQVRNCGRRIVLPEGWEPRAIRAAAALKRDRLADPILIGSPERIQAAAAAEDVNLSGIALLDPARVSADLVELYHQLRRHKGITQEQAQGRACQPHYYGALLVRSGQADGMVSGLNSETKPFLPAFEIIGLQPGIRRASSVFVMEWPDRVLFFADCSVNIAPDPPALAGIAVSTAATAAAFGYQPRVAFLSFSTRGSAQHPLVDAVKEAVRHARELNPDLVLDGEIQLDAALLPEVARKKAPDSPFTSAPANVFIFPDLNAANIAYKITERLAGARAIGPILQGLKQPVNDVSRGCSVEDLIDVATLTAVAAQG